MIHYSRGAVDVMQVAIKKLKPSAVVPSYGSLYSAGADLYACVESGIDILPGETVFVPTGVALEDVYAHVQRHISSEEFIKLHIKYTHRRLFRQEQLHK